MIEQLWRRFRSIPVSPVQALLVLLLCSLGPSYGQQPSEASDAKAGEKPTANEKAAGQEIAPRGQRMARDQIFRLAEVLFQDPGTNMVCRTTISGTFATGQSAVRIDLIEREGEGAARLQLFLPVGLYLQAGVKITVDQGTPHQFPYVWCLTNTCIAADLADPKLIAEMESGQRLLLEVVDSSVLTVSKSLPLDKVRSSATRDSNAGSLNRQSIE